MPLTSMEDVSPSYGLNHYRVDRPLALLLEAFGVKRDFSGLGALAGREVYEMAYRVDRASQPILVAWSYRGERSEKAWLDPAERSLLERLLISEGVNRPPFEGRSWLEHYTPIYLIGDPGISCILTITVQTAYALYKYGPSEVRGLYRNLSGMEPPAMWGATWFTEVSGGSDLGANETVARPYGSFWRLTGYKYFASGAGIADIALVTARPEGRQPGARNLELYAVPRTHDGKLNFRVTRLKWKSGTVSVPTGEVELDGSAAYLIGEMGKGIYYALEDLMVSRLANSFGALGIARKAYMEAYLYASQRRAFGKRIVEHELAVRDLLEMEVEIEALLALTMYAASLFDRAWGSRPPYDPGYHYARLITHIAKNLTAEASARITAVSMELWGGIGFLHEFPVERWHREAMITPIWEGTSNIQALDMLEAMQKKRAHETLLADMEDKAGQAYDERVSQAALKSLRETIELTSKLRGGEAKYHAKDILRALGRAAAVILLEHASYRLGDEGFHRVAELYLEWRVKGKSLPRPPAPIARDIVSLRGMLENK